LLDKCRGLIDELRNLRSTCVTDLDRLNVVKQKGYFPGNIKHKGAYRDLGLVACSKCSNHIGARSIFALMTYPGFRTPTIKHHCPRTALAASLRAMSNKVRPDKFEFAKYARWFRELFIPDVVNRLMQDEFYVQIEKWLAKTSYNEKYREQMRRALRPENQELGKVTCGYEAFAKIEMQFTEVPHEDKNTPLNDVKERQICGPKDWKKVVGNAIIAAIEELCHRHLPWYCGKKDWTSICKDVDEAHQTIPDIVFGAADGSGFDMTQLVEHNSLMNELFTKIVDHPNFLLDNNDLSKAEFGQILQDSLILNVSVDHGQLRYTAQGRASGDGWTTVGNTLLMISYWLYTADCASIPRDQLFLKVKGDDVLLGFSMKRMLQFESVRKKLFTMTKSDQEFGLGQICKKVLYGSIMDVDFLSNHFFITKDGRVRMTRIPARVFQTISYSTRLLDHKHTNTKLSLLYFKGSCLKAWASGLPIFSKLADKMMSLGRPGKVTDYDYYADWGRRWNPGKDDAESYLDYLEYRYGMTKETVIKIEAGIDRIKTFDDVVEIPDLAMFNQV
jgi:hypothetical protein